MPELKDPVPKLVRGGLRVGRGGEQIAKTTLKGHIARQGGGARGRLREPEEV